jgi:hypothetical protein
VPVTCPALGPRTPRRIQIHSPIWMAKNTVTATPGIGPRASRGNEATRA